ncbi:MAG: leucyl aminopeptidase family protein [Rhodospirillales bacterium]
MVSVLLNSARNSLPLDVVETSQFSIWRDALPKNSLTWVEASGFMARAGETVLLPDSSGLPASAALGVSNLDDVWALGDAGLKLPPIRAYKIRTKLSKLQATNAAISWALGAYKFDRYKTKGGHKVAQVIWPKGADKTLAESVIDGVSHARDLISTPANEMGPKELAAAARKIGRQHRAKISVIVGDDLLKKNFPTIHAVGRASSRAPRLIDMTWGNPRAPKVTLIGKGVCFDTGGLDLKPSGAMLNMKKDMGGAGNVLGLAHSIMATKLNIRLRVLIPAVENSVSGDAFRPLDVIKTRKGITVEIGNTDAEGRLVLCDAIALAVEENPDLVIDCATLTGAARVALGPSLPALFCNNDALAADILRGGLETDDQFWRLPLHQPYKSMLKGEVADLNNVSSGGFAGAITAALYLQAFIEDTVPWAHIDMMAWNPTGRPGRPKGGEAQGLRALLSMLQKRYC